GDRSGAVAHPGTRRAPVPRGQAPVGLRHGALPRGRQEPGARLQSLCAGKPLPGPPPAAAATGEVRLVTSWVERGTGPADFAGRDGVADSRFTAVFFMTPPTISLCTTTCAELP